VPALAGQPGVRPRADGRARLAGRVADAWHRMVAASGGWPAAAVIGCGVLATVIGLAGLLIGRGAGNASFGLRQVPAVRAPAGPVSAQPAPFAAGRPVARPVSLIIPAIGVRTRLVRLGLTAGGALQVPSATAAAGWYTRSPRPGAVGSSVIVGHVDSHRGPGVFFRLRLLRSPERIYVRKADGTLAVFRVTSVRSHLKGRFPTAAVYGPAPGSQLRLITCGGTFDPVRRSYLSNVVVYAVGIGRVGPHGRHSNDIDGASMHKEQHRWSMGAFPLK
jgi:hypothetical protein